MSASFSLSSSSALTLAHIGDSDETPAPDLRRGPTTLKFLRVKNTSGANAYVKLYDSANPTVGTTVPIAVFRVATGANRPIPINNFAGRSFVNGLSVACVTTGGTAGTTGPATNSVKVSLYTLDAA